MSSVYSNWENILGSSSTKPLEREISVADRISSSYMYYRQNYNSNAKDYEDSIVTGLSLIHI